MPSGKDEDMRQAVEDIASSGALGRSDRLKNLLLYLVEEELAGRGEAIKAYSIAIDVLNRTESFDPSSDNIVRVEVGRLRQSLSHYYSTFGTDATTVISIPRGTYRPSILAREEPPKEEVVAAPKIAKRDGVSLAVLPFYAFSVEYHFAGLAAGISNELKIELSRNKALAVVNTGLPRDGQRSFDVQEICEQRDIKYALQGTLQPVIGGMCISVDLYSARSDSVIWARSYDVDGEMTRPAQRDLVRKICTDLRPLFYNSEKLALEGMPLDELSADQLFVLSTWITGVAASSLSWEKRRVELAKRALTLRPEFGKAHSVLADKLVYLSAVDPESHSDEAIEAAEQHAIAASDLSSTDPDVFFNLSMHYWHLGNIEHSRAASQRAVDLDPNNALAHLMSFLVPFTCKPAPDDVFERLVDYEQSLSDDNPTRWFCQTWKSRLLLNAGDFDSSYTLSLGSNQYFKTPDTVMREATTLFKIGRLEPAVALVQGQMRNWPTFDPRHLTEVSLKRRRSSFPEDEDVVLAASREFVEAYETAVDSRVLKFDARRD